MGLSDYFTILQFLQLLFSVYNLAAKVQQKSENGKHCATFLFILCSHRRKNAVYSGW